MEIKLDVKKNVLTASLSGELDHHTAKEVKDVIEEVIKNREVKNLLFEFSHLTFMDSSGIGVIVGRYKLIASLGGQVVICGATGNIKKLLYVSGIDKIINIFDNQNEAYMSLEEGQF